MIYTNDRCVACNHCVHVCPAVGANVSANDNGRISIDVSDKNCIHCGKCIKACLHGAREYKDSLGEFLTDLKRGNAISVIVDPAFVVVYGMKKARQVFGYLKSLGVKGIYDGAIGGDISIFCHTEYLHANMDEEGKCDKFFSHTCPGFSNYVSRYVPDILDRFIPVQLPNVCAAIYYRKYRDVSDRFALLSPCTAIYDEFSSYNTGRNINYLIGFSSLLEHIGDTDISDLDSDFEIKCDGMGGVLCDSESFSRIVSRYFPANLLFKYIPGVDRKFEKMLNSPRFLERGAHPALVAVAHCGNGCVDGPAIDRKTVNTDDSVTGYVKVYGEAMSEYSDWSISADEKYARLKEKYSFVNLRDFEWDAEEDYRQKCSVPANVVEEIFESMHKTTRIKKELDCQACGYSSCYEMVCAVANGYSRIEDCVHYLNDEMKNQMGIDSLTGLYNQRGLFKAATKMVAADTGKKYLMILGDINGLGGINDLYGNNGGDLVITYVAKVLAEFCDKRGVCGRMGAGTFGCLFEDTGQNLEKFKEDTQLSVSHLGLDYPLAMKFGIYRLGNMNTTIARATLYATFAYRTCKDKSRNTYIFYTDEMSKSMSLEAEITQKMKSAMKNGEFVLYFQPKHDHMTGAMIGAEVLSRWNREDGSVVNPGVFVPVFEKNGFITEFDRYVWKRSFETVCTWQIKGLKAVPVSVNISRISLMDEGIVPFIESLKNEYPDAVKYIQFEITESAYVGDTHEIFDRVRHIQEMGFDINMDDFGSGYSSLNLLKDAPIDIVKLDMGFLRGEEDNRNRVRGNIIISSVINMTKELGLDIIAEGVETKEQADLLTSMGCHTIQGYFYAKPMPETEFIRRM